MWSLPKRCIFWVQPSPCFQRLYWGQQCGRGFGGGLHLSSQFEVMKVEGMKFGCRVWLGLCTDIRLCTHTSARLMCVCLISFMVGSYTLTEVIGAKVLTPTGLSKEGGTGQLLLALTFYVNSLALDLPQFSCKQCTCHFTWHNTAQIPGVHQSSEFFSSEPGLRQTPWVWVTK